MLEYSENKSQLSTAQDKVVFCLDIFSVQSKPEKKITKKMFTSGAAVAQRVEQVD